MSIQGIETFEKFTGKRIEDLVSEGKTYRKWK